MPRAVDAAAERVVRPMQPCALTAVSQAIGPCALGAVRGSNPASRQSETTARL
jgi:hypothetical protein